MMRCVFFIGVLFLALGSVVADEFTVAVYNVENLFDVDRVAKYSDYEQAPGGIYDSARLLVKLENIRRSLTAFNEGQGPEVVMFQEFELDLTPFDTPEAGEFLVRTKGRSLEDLFRDDPSTAGLPSELMLLKYLDDHDMGGYHIAQPDPFRMEDHSAQKNVVFSKFPVRSVRQRPMLEARDLLVVVLDVQGKELILLNNHWKSGASDEATEAIRIQNARVVRAELEAILFRNPAADVIIAGDFNCYYNHKDAFKDRLRITAINDVLESGDDESVMVSGGGYRLYNLWNERQPDERGSEVYRGYWGTLMQMILTPGLYDRKGIQYVDNSFGRLILPGVNVDERWNRPISWTNFGGGAGFSDHLPIYARFKVLPGDGDEGWMELDGPNPRISDKAYRPRIRFGEFNKKQVEPAQALAGLDELQLASRLGQLFLVNQPLSAIQPARVQIGDLELEIYCPIRDLRNSLNALQAGQQIKAYTELGVFRGRLQLVLQDKSWLMAP